MSKQTISTDIDTIHAHLYVVATRRVDELLRSVRAEVELDGSSEYTLTIDALVYASSHVHELAINGALHALQVARRKTDGDDAASVALRVRIARVEGFLSAINVAISAASEDYYIAGV